MGFVSPVGATPLTVQYEITSGSSGGGASLQIGVGSVLGGMATVYFPNPGTATVTAQVLYLKLTGTAKNFTAAPANLCGFTGSVGYWVCLQSTGMLGSAQALNVRHTVRYARYVNTVKAFMRAPFRLDAGVNGSMMGSVRQTYYESGQTGTPSATATVVFSGQEISRTPEPGSGGLLLLGLGALTVAGGLRRLRARA